MATFPAAYTSHTVPSTNTFSSTGRPGTRSIGPLQLHHERHGTGARPGIETPAGYDPAPGGCNTLPRRSSLARSIRPQPRVPAAKSTVAVILPLAGIAPAAEQPKEPEASISTPSAVTRQAPRPGWKAKGTF